MWGTIFLVIGALQPQTSFLLGVVSYALTVYGDALRPSY